jgi:hypothetical protein
VTLIYEYIQGLKLLRWARRRYGKLVWDELVSQHPWSAFNSEFFDLVSENKYQIYGCIHVFAKKYIVANKEKDLIGYVTKLGLSFGKYFLKHRILFLNVECCCYYSLSVTY